MGDMQIVLLVILVVLALIACSTSTRHLSSRRNTTRGKGHTHISQNSSPDAATDNVKAANRRC
jgi:hypothetical protein